MPYLRTLRHRHGLTILEIAQRSGLTARAIAELEYGLRPLDAAERLSLARSYDLAPEDLETPRPVPAAQSWEYLARILSQQLILAALTSTLVVTLLFGGAIAGAESHAPVASARPVAQGDGLGRRLSSRYLLAPPFARRRPTTTLPHHGMERAILAAAPTMTPTATPRSLPSATPRPAPTATPLPPPTAGASPLPTDAPSPVPAAVLQLAPTEMPSPVPPDPPSPAATEAPSPVPTDPPSPAPTDVPSPAATEAPGPVPTDVPSPLPTEVPSPVPTDVPSPLPTEVPSPVPTDAPSPLPPEAFSPSAGAVPQSSVFMPLPADGPFHQNVVAALEANNGALQHVVIPPNGVWSFNRTVGDPGLLQLEPIFGVYGGGWCDLASRYTMVLRPLLPPESFDFIRHIDSTGYGLEGVPDDDGVVIWNSNGADGEQDLRIDNTTGRTIRIDVTLVGDGVQFQATIV
jgi:transcriptional regulator with XRE-family HTH domain